MFTLLLLALVNVVELKECPAGYDDTPLVLVSLDGFRADYLERGLTPNILALKERGTSVPYLIPSNPTITFPNHYTIVTGLYPESHGIISNNFFDPSFNQSFNIKSKESGEAKWWGGEPVWNTVVKQGKKSGAIYWIGSGEKEEGFHPTYYYKYSKNKLTLEQRIDQILDWLSLPTAERPIIICTYIDEPDKPGHKFGPNSQQVNESLVHVDALIKRLVEGIDNKGLTNCVNLIVLSDHGMMTTGKKSIVDFTKYVPNLDTFGHSFYGSIVRFNVDPNHNGDIDAIRRNLTCQRKEFRQYTPLTLPTRYHFSNNDRIGDLILTMAVGSEGEVNYDWYSEGDHGYDNYYHEMRAIFMGDGPAFRKKTEVEPFQNIEIYNLLCHLVGVIPAPNNGTQASLYHLLQDPPPYPTLPKESPHPVSPPFPSEDQISDRQRMSGCPGDESAPVQALNFTTEEKKILLTKHLPWGIPHAGDWSAELLLLFQEDHVTGYSPTLKMPLWTSFTLDHAPFDKPTSDWSSDVRLTSQNTPTCNHYHHLQQYYNASMQPLFSNRFGSDSESGTVPFVVSNGVPMTSSLLPRWHYLTEGLLPQWLTEGHAPINVIVGPIFDKDANSLVDDFTQFKSPALPSHLFLIATRCRIATAENSLSACSQDQLDSMAFIFPERDDIPNCMSNRSYALEFSCKLHDVELASGLTFHPSLPYAERTSLALRIHSRLWPTDNEELMRFPHIQ